MYLHIHLKMIANLVVRSLQNVIRTLVGMIVNKDRNESKQMKKPTDIS